VAVVFRSLRFKVSFYLVVALSIAVLLFTIMVIRNNREEMMQQAISHAGQLSEVVIKSTRFAMLQNQPSQVGQIISDVGVQRDIDRVRILSKSGTVIHSSQPDEIGKVIDQEAEACVACHVPDSQKQILFTGLNKNCYSCHKDPHQEQFTKNDSKEGAVTPCSNCHTPRNWNAEKFDHNQQASFKLTGAHARLECSKCHFTITQNNVTFVKYKPIPNM